MYFPETIIRTQLPHEWSISGVHACAAYSLQSCIIMKQKYIKIPNDILHVGVLKYKNIFLLFYDL